MSWARNTLKIIIHVKFKRLGMFSSVALLDCSKPTVCCPVLCLGVLLEGKFISTGRIFQEQKHLGGLFRQQWRTAAPALHKQKQKELQTTGAGEELHICMSLRPGREKRLHLVGKVFQAG